MRVLLSTYGSRGDVEPVLGLAVRLRELGAEVRVCAPPDFAERVAGAGVEMVPVGLSASELTKARPPVSEFPRFAAELIGHQFTGVLDAARDCEAMVVTGMLPMIAGALSVAEKLGIYAASVVFQKLSLPSPHHRPMAYPGHPFPPEVTDNRELWKLNAQTVNKLFGDALNTNRAANGLAPVTNVQDYLHGDQQWLATDQVLDPWHPTPDLDVVQTGAWILPHERPLPADLEAFLAAGPPPVYVGFGSMPMHAATDVAQVAIDAVRALGHRVVVLRGWAGLDLIDDRADCFAVGEVNQQALFPRMAAIVHHGGAGTTTTASRSGAPQVIIPQIADQPYWAGRVAELGIGAAHEGPAPTVGSLTAALRIALAPGTRERAREVAGTIRTDGALVAAELLLETIKSRKARA
ncbi:glycosyltransferase [Crossiella sp. CA198]|uniref:glycosyltransferase n=1 Tax=Crossiella sp. CA198 TaxID=3455607 RepID=UPI003F8D8278